MKHIGLQEKAVRFPFKLFFFLKEYLLTFSVLGNGTEKDDGCVLYHLHGLLFFKESGAATTCL